MACKKKPHKSHKVATDTIFGMYRSKAAQWGSLEVYKCRRCKKFHIGHKKGYSKIRPKTLEKIRESYQ